VFSPAPGAYTGSVDVTLSTTTPGASIFYTTDGSEPTLTSTAYTAAITLTSTTTIRAIAGGEGLQTSAVAEGAYTVEPLVASPDILPESGEYFGSLTIIMSTETAGASIHYTLDGSTPDNTSAVYSDPITIDELGELTVRAVSIVDNQFSSEVITRNYTISEIPAPPAITANFGDGSDFADINLDPSDENFELILMWNPVPFVQEYALVGVLVEEGQEKSAGTVADQINFETPDFTILADEDGTLPRVTLNYEVWDQALFDAGVRPSETVNFVLAIRATGPGGVSISNPSPVGTITRHESAPDPVSTERFQEIPTAITLEQNYPNPFNPTTTIRFALPDQSEIRLEVYTITGQRVAVLAEGSRSAGWHTVTFEGAGLSSGVYIYRLQSAGAVQTRKLLLVK
jgi:hypothetical protein